MQGNELPAEQERPTHQRLAPVASGIRQPEESKYAMQLEFPNADFV